MNRPDSSLLKAVKVRDDGLLPDSTLRGAEFAGFQGLEDCPQNLLSHAALRRIELFYCSVSVRIMETVNNQMLQNSQNIRTTAGGHLRMTLAGT